MNQVSYVLQKDLHFTDVNFYAKSGDVFVHTPPSQVVVYRNGEIQIQMGTTQASINGLAVSGILHRDHAKAEMVSAPVVETPAPKLEDEPEAPKAEAPVDPQPETGAEEPEAPATEEEAPAVETPETEAPAVEDTPEQTPVVEAEQAPAAEEAAPKAAKAAPKAAKKK